MCVLLVTQGTGLTVNMVLFAVITATGDLLTGTTQTERPDAASDTVSGTVL